jgi:hypothetical protein
VIRLIQPSKVNIQAYQIDQSTPASHWIMLRPSDAAKVHLLLT